jgi:hypothetical protein
MGRASKIMELPDARMPYPNQTSPTAIMALIEHRGEIQVAQAATAVNIW